MSGPEPEAAGTEIADSILDLIGNTPMVKLPRLSRVAGPRRDACGEARDDEPGRQRQRSSRGRDDRRRRARRPAEAGWHHRRAHIGQHRRRPRDRRRAAGLQVRVRHDRQGRAREDRVSARRTAPRSSFARSRWRRKIRSRTTRRPSGSSARSPGRSDPNQYANPAQPAVARRHRPGPRSGARRPAG